MKLHRQLLSALLLAAPLSLSAESIDAQQAAVLAAEQLESTTEALTLVYTAADPTNGEPTFYAFNREGGGFVLVAADDRVDHVVLAYNYYGAYNHDDLYGDLRSWMDGYSAAVSKARQQPADASRRAPRKATTTEGVPDFVKPLIGDPQYRDAPGFEQYVGYMPWNQYSPLNDKCPKYNGGTCAVGCVALSMAQVMSKHKWPTQAEGTASYLWKEQTLTTTFDQPYNWNLLKYRYTGGYTTEEGEFISTLLRDIGYSIHMNYGSGYEGSGTAEEYAAKALYNHFKYDKSVSYLCRDYCTTQYWEDMLRREIAAGRPVMYGGGSDVGAHEYTCDGYDAQGRFFFHMGSTGQDGYYATLSPELQYTTSQTAIFRIMPNNDAAATGKASMLVGSNKHFLWKEGTNISSNVRFFTPVESFNAQLAVAVENTTTGEVTYCNQQSLTTSIENNNGTVVTDFSVSGTYPDGTYKVYPVYRSEADGRWQKVLFGEYCQDYVTLSVSGGQQTFSNDNIRENIDEGKVKVDGIIYALNGANGTAAVTYQNNSYNSYSGDVVIPGTVSYGGRTYRVSAIDEKAFYDCDNLQSVVIGSNVESIGYGAFYSSKVSSVTFAEGSRLNTIATFAFYYSSITDIKLPEGVRTISNEAFNATDLKHVDIPSTVSYLGKNVFAYCSWIETFTNRCTTPLGSLTDDPFSGISEFWLSTMTLYVPKGCREAYAAHPVWSRFGKIVELDEEVTPPVDPGTEPDPEPEAKEIVYTISPSGHASLYLCTDEVSDNQYFTYSLSATPEYFRIVESGSGYTLQSTRTGKLLGKSKGNDHWNMADNAQVWMIGTLDGTAQILLEPSKGLGWDNSPAVGSGIFNNKSGKFWDITPVAYSGDSAGLMANMIRRAIAGKCAKEDVEAVINNILLRKQ